MVRGNESPGQKRLPVHFLVLILKRHLPSKTTNPCLTIYDYKQTNLPLTRPLSFRHDLGWKRLSYGLEFFECFTILVLPCSQSVCMTAMDHSGGSTRA